jgi:hypothetical protein
MDPRRHIDSVEVHLKGFTVEELKDIIWYIRSVEAHRPTKLVYIQFDTPDLRTEDAKKLIQELWYDEAPPKFSIILPRENRDDQEGL